MQSAGTVVLIDVPTGRFALQAGDGSYLLAEQLDTQPLRVGDALSGPMENMGIETFTDTRSAAEYSVNILAYGLSLDAIEQELR